MDEKTPANIEPAASSNIPEITKTGKKSFAAVFIAATEKEKAEGKSGQVIQFSDQEAAIMQSFLKTCSYKITADEVGIKLESVKRILRRPHMKRYLAEIIKKTAIKEGTDEAWAIKTMREVWEGERTPTPMQMAAFKELGRYIAPSRSGVTINNQQNSIYGGMSKEVIDAQWTDARTTAAD